MGPCASERAGIDAEGCMIEPGGPSCLEALFRQRQPGRRRRTRSAVPTDVSLGKTPTWPGLGGHTLR